MVSMALGITKKDAFNMVYETISTGKAYDKFVEIVSSQGGDVKGITVAKKKVDIISPETGVLSKVSAILQMLFLRYGFATVCAVLLWFTLPFDSSVKLVLVVIVFAPITSFACSFSEHTVTNIIFTLELIFLIFSARKSPSSLGGFISHRSTSHPLSFA